MIYLYVPFNNSEENRKLIKLATQWRNATYASSHVACTILSSEDKFASPHSAMQKTKIYILAYEAIDIGSTGKIASSSESAQYSLTLEELTDRLLASGMPENGIVDIKLCIKWKEASDNPLIFAEAMRESLLRKNYRNLDLLIRVQYSEEPFPGETSKLSYRNVVGSMPIFFQPDSKPEKHPTAEIDSVDQASSTL